MKSLLTKSIKLKADAYQYQIQRFGVFYSSQKPLTKALARTLRVELASERKSK